MDPELIRLKLSGSRRKIFYLVVRYLHTTIPRGVRVHRQLTPQSSKGGRMAYHGLDGDVAGLEGER